MADLYSTTLDHTIWHTHVCVYIYMYIFVFSKLSVSRWFQSVPSASKPTDFELLSFPGVLNDGGVTSSAARSSRAFCKSLMTFCAFNTSWTTKVAQQVDFQPYTHTHILVEVLLMLTQGIWTPLPFACLISPKQFCAASISCQEQSKPIQVCDCWPVHHSIPIDRSVPSGECPMFPDCSTLPDWRRGAATNSQSSALLVAFCRMPNWPCMFDASCPKNCEIQCSVFIMLQVEQDVLKHNYPPSSPRPTGSLYLQGPPNGLNACWVHRDLSNYLQFKQRSYQFHSPLAGIVWVTFSETHCRSLCTSPTWLFVAERPFIAGPTGTGTPAMNIQHREVHCWLSHIYI